VVAALDGDYGSGGFAPRKKSWVADGETLLRMSEIRV
jgi:hypothetical protein